MAIDSSKFEARTLIARSYNEQHEYERANEELNAAEALMTEDTHQVLKGNYFNERGVAALGLGQKPLALECFREAMRLIPSVSSAAFYNAALVLKDLGQPDEAISTMYRALNIAANFRNFSFLIDLLKGAGRFDQALQCCDQMVACYPTAPEAYSLRGLTRFLIAMDPRRLKKTTYGQLRDELRSDLQNALRYGGEDAEQTRALEAIIIRMQ
jgi:tetratricopeptide (TPR) repeat protein